MGSHPQLLICLWALPPDSMSWLRHCRAVALQGTSKKVWNRKGMCTDWLLDYSCTRQGGSVLPSHSLRMGWKGTQGSLRSQRQWRVCTRAASS